MAFQIPDLDQIIERVKTDIKGGLNITTVARRSFIAVISRAIAGISHLMFLFLSFISRQLFPDTAEDEYLERWASIYGLTKTPATFAEFNITVTGNNGGVIPESTLYQSKDGSQFESDSEVTIGISGSATVLLVAIVSGSSKNPMIADKMNLISPIANVNSEAVVASIVTEAADTESTESLRERFISRLRLPPLGGSANDYIQWAREVPGVTRSWVFPLYTGAGTVAVSFVVDGQEDIIPTGPKVDEVEEYISELKPVTALLEVFAPVPLKIDLDISIKPNTTTVQNAIIDELADLVKRESQVAGAYKSPSENYDGSILLSKIRQAISIASGLEDFEINTINGVSPANLVPDDGELVILGGVSWQSLA